MRGFSEVSAVLLVVVFLGTNSHLIAGQTAPAPAVSCSSVLYELIPCLDFLSNESVLTPPATCCGAITNITISAPVCLCEFISPAYANQTAALGINGTRALELPTLCSLGVSTSNCAALLGSPTPSLPPAPTGLGPALAPTTLAPAPALIPTPALAPTPVSVAPVSPAPVAPVPSIAPTPVSSPTPILAPASAEAPTSDCSSTILELSPCLSFVTGVEFPVPAACCTSFASVAASAPICICQLASSGASSSIQGVNTTLALELPGLCGDDFDVNICLGGSIAPSSAESPLPLSPGNTATIEAARPFVVIVMALAAALQLVFQ